LSPSAEVNDASYHRGTAWVPLGELPSQLAYGEGIYDTIAKLIERYSQR
jgi:hypothetical protein